MKTPILLLLLLFSIILSSCKINYYGYVYDFDKEKPINNVKIYVNDTSQSAKTISNQNGYFQFKSRKEIKKVFFKNEKFKLKEISALERFHEYKRKIPSGDTIYLKKKNSSD